MTSSSRVLRALLLVYGTASLYACGGGSGSAGMADPAPSSPSPPTSPAERCAAVAPLSGNPALRVLAGDPFSYTPTLPAWDDADFILEVDNLPPWATFDETTGRLSGTPTSEDAGLYDEITISATIEEARIVVEVLAIAVAANGNGAVTLTWTPPTRRVDGTALTNLAGYRIYYSRSGSGYVARISLEDAGVTSFVVERLSAGHYCFAVSAVDAQGLESDLSTATEKTVM